MGKYNIGDVWWVEYPFSERNETKHRPAIIVDDETIAILALYVTSKDKDNPYSIAILDWKEAGLAQPSWARIDRIVEIKECHIDCRVGSLSERDALKMFQLVAEITQNKFHEFSILAVSDMQGKYLQIYDDRWACWLFPYVRTTDNNKENVDLFASKLLQKEVSTTYVTVARHCKYSVSDCVYKIYNHKLYSFRTNEHAEYLCDDAKYRWMTIEELEQDSEVMEKNDDVIAFVKANLV